MAGGSVSVRRIPRAVHAGRENPEMVYREAVRRAVSPQQVERIARSLARIAAGSRVIRTDNGRIAAPTRDRIAAAKVLLPYLIGRPSPAAAESPPVRGFVAVIEQTAARVAGADPTPLLAGGGAKAGEDRDGTPSPTSPQNPQNPPECSESAKTPD